jgi:hypothetical protein
MRLEDALETRESSGVLWKPASTSIPRFQVFIKKRRKMAVAKVIIVRLSNIPYDSTSSVLGHVQRDHLGVLVNYAQEVV